MEAIPDALMDVVSANMGHHQRQHADLGGSEEEAEPVPGPGVLEGTQVVIFHRVKVLTSFPGYYYYCYHIVCAIVASEQYIICSIIAYMTIQSVIRVCIKASTISFVAHQWRYSRLRSATKHH